MSTVGPPKMRNTFSTAGKPAGVVTSSVLLGLRVLCGGATVELLEHVALLEGVVYWGLVV
jgi:hypothetical protein